ncbi:DoxX family protein [Edaphobacter bradus]|uniref:DoxX family protein n=1 Tax=Edaphobacter bradus TaxID=2259016 RepID=UPI0021DF890F|nr:DoxX family protein [Edaphobacter bradus]
MKIAILIARFLLGLMFVVFGLNVYLNFIHMAAPTGDGGALLGLMFQHGWFTFFGVLYIVGGTLLLIGRFVPIGLVLLGPIIVVILLFHITFYPAGIGPGLFAAVLEVFLIWACRAHFEALFAPELNVL